MSVFPYPRQTTIPIYFYSVVLNEMEIPAINPLKLKPVAYGFRSILYWSLILLFLLLHYRLKIFSDDSKKFPLSFSQTVFQAYGIKPGPLHGMLTSTPYLTKDLLQAKRFKAQTMGTTYVYDFPEMFRQVLTTIWKDYATQSGWGTAIPDDMVICQVLPNVFSFFILSQFWIYVH